MEEYPKIESLFDRDEGTHRFVVGRWRLPEFEYLRNCEWRFTEKVDGTNIRIGWDGEKVQIGGRTERVQIPVFLLDRLVELFPAEKFGIFDGPVCLYGEGYGARIQKGGGKYKADGVDFVLFDVKVDRWWLRHEDMLDVAGKLGIDVVPIRASGNLDSIIKFVRDGFPSWWGEFPAEGLVGRPIVDLCRRSGERIIVKLKTRDF